ncbi:MAG: hypothetical protein HY319_14590 [Armatimonadetes bacterium]|nr:hypothetical protein [Armatimonadota bacterium]
MAPTVDAVYTWVDGSWPGFQEALRSYASTATDLNPRRYRDLYLLLKFSLRSLERFVPWVRDVYFVTCRPQVPPWLDTANPRVRIVHHDEIIEPQYLPTFSTRVIESYIHRVPSEADFLLSMQDDWLFGRPTELGDFLADDGRIRVHGTFLGEAPDRHVYADRRIPSTTCLEHVPRLVDPALWGDMLEWRREEVERTRRNRFRREGDLRMDRLYRVYLLSRRQERSVAVPFFRTLAVHRFHSITDDLPRQRKKLERLQTRPPKFYCLNDDQGPNPSPPVAAAVQHFLDRFYPDPSSFERAMGHVEADA